jgi:hypothetical protein
MLLLEEIVVELIAIAATLTAAAILLGTIICLARGCTFTRRARLGRGGTPQHAGRSRLKPAAR